MLAIRRIILLKNGNMQKSKRILALNLHFSKRILAIICFFTG